MKGAERTALALLVMMFAQASPSEAQTWRLDLTSHATLPDWQAVSPDATFDAVRGYGFETRVGDYKVFSVAAPEGDYAVTLWPAVQGPMSVWAESRRLMARSVEGPVRFTVNVRRPELGPSPPDGSDSPQVRLNARELGSRSWDDRLTLAFDQSVARIEIVPVTETRLVLLGDSTVADQGEGDYFSWGQMLPHFVDRTVSVANHAESGESLKSFLKSQRLDKALSQLRPGDVVVIQFGHNDSKAQYPLTYAEAETTFRSYLRLYVDEIRRRGASPVLVTSPHRRTFDPDGRIRNSHGSYPEATRAVAREQAVPLIDLTLATARLYEALGPEGSRQAFADSGRDGSHHNAYGACLLAWAVADGLRAIDAPIADRISTEIPVLDLDNPPAFENFDLKLLPSRPTQRPAGS